MFFAYGTPLNERLNEGDKRRLPGEWSKSPLVGMLMLGRPTRCPQAYLDSIHDTFGDYQIGPMTSSGDRGLYTHMAIEDPLSLSFVRDALYGPDTDRARYVLDFSCQNGTCRRVTVSCQKGVLYSEGVQ